METGRFAEESREIEELEFQLEFQKCKNYKDSQRWTYEKTKMEKEIDDLKAKVELKDKNIVKMEGGL
jgi:hypothetical protein